MIPDRGPEVRVDLVEFGEERELLLPDAVGVALADSGFVGAAPVPGGRGLWRLKPGSAVGAVSVADVEVHVHPKIPVERVVWLLEASAANPRWRDLDRVEVSHAPDLLTVVVDAFERLTTRALRLGLVQGYRTREEALATVRGRIREADQLRRHPGRALPIEVRYDDFTVDTAENRLLRSAVSVGRRLRGLPPQLRYRLAHLDARFTDVAGHVAGRSPEPWAATRLNSRFHAALRLADVIVRGGSFETRGAGLTVTGFVIDMAKVFEDFVVARLTPRLRAVGGRVRAQFGTHLDVDRTVVMRPDLVWQAGDGSPLAVVDVKYKAEKPSGVPNADLYQALAYATALGLPTAHLVYAMGEEPRRITCSGAGVRIGIEILDLRGSPAEILPRVDQVAEAIVAASATEPGAAGHSIREGVTT